MLNRRTIKLVAINGELVERVAGKHQRGPRAKRRLSLAGQGEETHTRLRRASPSATDSNDREPRLMTDICTGAVSGAAARSSEGHLNGLNRRGLGRASIDEQAHSFVGDPSPLGQSSHREAGRPELRPKLSGGGCDFRHAQNGTAEPNPQSSAEPMPRVLRSAIWHSQGMASFRKNLEDMVEKRTARSLARVVGIDEKTIRNWLKKGEPSNHLKARQFLEALSLPWPQALGEYELTPEWWAGFHAKFDDTPADRAIAHIKAVDWDTMSPEQQQAVRSVVVAFETPETPPKRTARSANTKVKRAS